VFLRLNRVQAHQTKRLREKLNETANDTYSGISKDGVFESSL